MEVLEVKNLRKIYGGKLGVKTEALSCVNFTVNKGEFVSIMGESGSGKTTLLNIIATLDKPTEGTVLIGGKDISKLKDKEIATFRREELGFVFQDFNLLDSFSNRDNIYLPLVLSGVKADELEAKINKIAPILGIEEILDKYPYQISGGQKQRVAIARALIVNPSLILADEPTGALDSKSSEITLKLFDRINDEGQTILMVTHSVRAAAYSSRVLFIRDGKVFHEIYKGDDTTEEFMDRITASQSLLNRGGGVIEG